MASQLPPELLESLLRGAFDPPGTDDVDIGRERARRDFLRSCSEVSRHWRAVALVVLPESLVIGGELRGSGAVELEAHVSAVARGYLDASRTTCVTVENVRAFRLSGTSEQHHLEAEALRLEALRQFVQPMSRLRLLRFGSIHAATYFAREWPGRHWVVDRTSGEASLALAEMTDNSEAVTALTILRPGTEVYIGGACAFADRVVALNIGTPVFPTSNPCAYFPNRLPALRHARVAVPRLGPRRKIASAVKLVRELAAQSNQIPFLTRLLIVIDETSAPTQEAHASVGDVLSHLPRSITHFGLQLHDHPQRTQRTTGIHETMADVVEALVAQLDVLADVSLASLALDMRGCQVERSGRLADAAEALERACGARGVRLELEV